MIRYTIWQIFPTFINTVPLRAMPISTSGPWLWTRVYNNKFIAILSVFLLWFRFGYWPLPGSASMLVLPDTFDVCLAKQKTFVSCNNSLSDVYCSEIYTFVRTTYWFYLAVLEVVLQTVGLCKFLFLKMKSASPALGFFTTARTASAPTVSGEKNTLARRSRSFMVLWGSLVCPSLPTRRRWRRGRGGALPPGIVSFETPLAQDNDWDVIPEQIQ